MRRRRVADAVPRTCRRASGQRRETARAETPSCTCHRCAGIGYLSRSVGRVGQDAIAAGDFGAAVVAFRKSAYLAPNDPVAQLHLGLALDAAGDEPSAQRAYAAARHALIHADPAHSIAGIEGYATAELRSLLDSKQRRVTP